MKALKIIRAVAKGVLTVIRWLIGEKKEKNKEQE
jgi:hypothetical protein